MEQQYVHLWNSMYILPEGVLFEIVLERTRFKVRVLVLDNEHSKITLFLTVNGSKFSSVFGKVLGFEVRFLNMKFVWFEVRNFQVHSQSILKREGKR